VQRGQIYTLPPDEDGKERPVVIVSRDNLNAGHSVLAIPFTSQQLDKRRQQPWCVLFRTGEGGLSKDCVARCDQITLFRKGDINTAKPPLGRLTAAQMQRIVDAVRHAIRDDTLHT
jgi:mRNA-degrading endonuclease toxin of MazEF toxin-antitoxin module